MKNKQNKQPRNPRGIFAGMDEDAFSRLKKLTGAKEPMPQKENTFKNRGKSNDSKNKRRDNQRNTPSSGTKHST
jgi:hypothetical protein